MSFRAERGIAVIDDRTLVYHVVSAPIGRLIVASNGGAIAAVWMANANPSDALWSERRGDDSVLAEAGEQLTAYFAGKLRAFTLPLAPNGTDFQRRVWHELEAIPFGTTVTYAEIARRVGSTAAVRAVGAANGRNPIPIIVPCHRVIGSDGSLTGFGGGLDRKLWLLRHEGALPDVQEELAI